MKKRLFQFLIVGLLGSGTYVVNNTEADIVLDNGDMVISQGIFKSDTKSYKFRPIDAVLDITIHHTAGDVDDDVDAIAKFHVKKRGWPGIAYHVAVDQDGKVFLLNPLEKRTYHDSGENTNSIGIVLIGNFEEIAPSKEMIKTVTHLIDLFCMHPDLNIGEIRGHKDTSPTLCPGKNAYNKLKPLFG